MTNLNSSDPLGYTGINKKQQPKFQSFPRSPTSTDFLNFEIGDEWLDTSVNPAVLYFLVSVTATSGIWQKLETGSATIFPAGVLTGNGTTSVVGSVVDQFGVVVGKTLNQVDSVAPTATTGIPLVSTGTSSNPSFTTASVSGGGTGNTSVTEGQLLKGAPTSTNPLVPFITNTDEVLIGDGTGGIKSEAQLVVGKGGTGASTLTDGGILLGSGTGAVTATSQPTNGQLLIGSTGADPVLGNLTSTGATISITEGAGTINLESSGGSGSVIKIYQTNQSNADSTTNIIPTDDTIPQITEGTQILSVNLTLSSLGNAFIFDFVGTFSAAGLTVISVTFGETGVANCLDVAAQTVPISNYIQNISLQPVVFPSDINQHTYQFRYGPSTSTTAYINKGSSTLLSSIAKSTLTVYEVTFSSF